jgi:hypothetical protein
MRNLSWLPFQFKKKGTGASTQGLHLEPLHHFFVMSFFKMGSYGTICLSWLWIVFCLVWGFFWVVLGLNSAGFELRSPDLCLLSSLGLQV